MENYQDFDGLNFYEWDACSIDGEVSGAAFYRGWFDHGAHRGMTVKDCSFEYVWFSASAFEDVTFENVDFTDAMWHGCTFEGVTFKNCTHNGRPIRDQTHTGGAYDFFQNV